MSLQFVRFSQILRDATVQSEGFPAINFRLTIFISGHISVDIHCSMYECCSLLKIVECTPSLSYVVSYFQECSPLATHLSRSPNSGLNLSRRSTPMTLSSADTSFFQPTHSESAILLRSSVRFSRISDFRSFSCPMNLQI